MSTRRIAEQLGAAGAVNGRVGAIRGGQLHVATPRGLELLPASTGVRIGDAMRVIEGRVTRASERVGPTFHL